MACEESVTDSFNPLRVFSAWGREASGVKVLVSSPFPLEGGSGNAVTALRVAGLLQDGEACHGWDGRPADLMIALHAHRSREVVEAFARETGGKVAILLTGTDLYEFSQQELIEIGLGVDALVVMHELALESLPEELRGCAHVIYPSVTLPQLKAEPEPGLVTQLGHLRPVKNPFMALQCLQGESVRLVHIGAALSPQMEEQAQSWMEREPRYRWLGALSREEALTWLSRSTVTLNTSHSEGASNVVLEALGLGVPILASRVEGNLGLLGADYEGFYQEQHELASALHRALADSAWRRRLRTQLQTRAPLFEADQESQSWGRLLNRLGF